MKTFEFSLHRHQLDPGKTLYRADEALSAFWLMSGAIEIAGATISSGEGAYFESAGARVKAGCDVIVFSISPQASTISPLLESKFEWDGPGVFRLDQVHFPPRACAYRHIHPGPGIRFLSAGQLEIKSDHDSKVAGICDAWFEGANSPVQATAGAMPTTFVRAMLLPLEYLGKPTLKILNDEDKTKPRLQKNTRFFDRIVDLSDT